MMSLQQCQALLPTHPDMSNVYLHARIRVQVSPWRPELALGQAPEEEQPLPESALVPEQALGQVRAQEQP